MVILQEKSGIRSEFGKLKQDGLYKDQPSALKLKLSFKEETGFQSFIHINLTCQLLFKSN